MPKCDQCFCEMEMVDQNETCEAYACLYCDIIPSMWHPEIAMSVERPPYINHCWKCQAGIDSRVCERSVTPSNGYHCNVCGVDLAGNIINIYA